MDVIDVNTEEKKSTAPKVIQATEAVESTAEELPTDSGKPLRTGLLLLLLGFGGFMAWAAIAPIDSGVASNGTVTLEGRRKTIQHLTGGIVKKIMVREGQSVEEGTVLMRMDDAVPLANKSNAESQLSSAEVQVKYLDGLIADLQPMVEDGFYPKNRVLEMKKQRAEALAQQAAFKDRLVAADLELRRTVVHAPVAGKVMGLVTTTDGAVLQPGAKLMDIVPDEERLVVEAQVLPNVIDRIYPGLTAEVRFTTVRARATPVILGKVEWVSADKFQDPQNTSMPTGYFTVRVVVSADELKKLGDTQVRPGMMADVILKTGERTFLQYIMRPLTDSMARALKEY